MAQTAGVVKVFLALNGLPEGGGTEMLDEFRLAINQRWDKEGMDGACRKSASIACMYSSGRYSLDSQISCAERNIASSPYLYYTAFLPCLQGILRALD